MKRMLVVVIMAIVVTAMACKRDSDILSTYDGGAVTRGEFKSWILARNIPQEVTKKKAKQQELLDRLSLERLIVMEARTQGFDKEADFQYTVAQAERTFFAASLAKRLNSEQSFKEKAARARIIKLQVKDSTIVHNKAVPLSPAELETAFAEKERRAMTILAELGKGASFEDLAKKYSDDFSKTNGGDIGYVVAGMRGEEFSRALFDLKEGQYTKKPVRQTGGVYIIKLEEMTELTDRTIDDIITDKRMAAGLRRKITIEKIKLLQQQLAAAKDVEDHIDQAGGGNPAGLLFKVGDRRFTGADLNAMIAMIGKKRMIMGYKPIPFDSEAKKKEAARLFREELLAREVVKRGMDKESQFQRELAFFRDYNLARSYEEERILAGIRVGEDEVRREYEVNRDKMYSRMDEQKGKKVKTVIPYGTVRESIQFRLLNLKKSEARREWEAALKKRNKYTVAISELEGAE